MKKHITVDRIFRVLTIVALSFSLITLMTEATAEVASGTCGTNVSWTFTQDGTLTISGSGPMDPSFNSYCPWSEYIPQIQSVIVEEGVTRIGSYAFFDHDSLKNVQLSDSVTDIGGYAFCRCEELVAVDLPHGLKEIADSTFFNCAGLSDVTIPDSVKRVGETAFRGCTGLTTVVIGNGVETIDDYAFRDCDGLTDVLLPDSVVTLGHCVFFDCDGLTSIIIPKGVTTISSNPFNMCKSLTEIKVAEDNVTFGAVDGVLFNEVQKELIAYPMGKTEVSYEIPNGVKIVGINAFEACAALLEINIPQSVTKIEASAFEKCRNVKSITIPNGVTEIGSSAFLDCDALTSMSIPEGVTWLYYALFSGCDNLTEVIIPRTVKNIHQEVFKACGKLTDIYFTGTKEEWDEILWYSSRFGGTVHFNYTPPAYVLNELVLLDSDERELESIPCGNFYAEAKVRKQKDADPAVIILAAYTSEGRFLELTYVRANVPTGTSYASGTWFDNTDGRIGEIKAFVVASLRSMTPIGNSKSVK